MGKSKKKGVEEASDNTKVADKAEAKPVGTPERPVYYPCMEEKSNIFSYLTFYWTGGLVARGNHHILKPNDLFDLKDSQKFEHVIKTFDMYFQRYSSKDRPRTGKALMSTTRYWLFVNLFLSTLGNLLQFAGPLCLTRILENLGNPLVDAKDAYIYASIMLGCYLLRSFFIQHGTHASNYNAFTTVAAAQGAIFSKALRLKNSAKKYYDTGKIQTMCTVDSFALFMFAFFGNNLFIAPFVVIVAVVLICLQVGWIGLVGPGILVISMYLQNVVQRATERTRKKSLFFNAKRASALSEYIAGIRIIKFYGWERMVQKKIQQIRKHEAKFIFMNAVLRSLTELLTSVVPIIISIVIFALYQVALKQDLTPAKAYSVLALFNLIQVPLRFLTIVLVALANAKVSLRRIGHFLTAEEYDNYVVRDDPSMEVGDVSIEEGTFAWDTESARAHFKKIEKYTQIGGRGGPGGPPGGGPPGGKKPAGGPGGPGSPNKDGPGSPRSDNSKEPGSPGSDPGSAGQKSGKKKKGPQKPKSTIPDEPLKQEDLIVLRNINFKARRGKIVGIIGQVGSGKTSLLNAILGELDKINGNVRTKGTVAFVSQQAFLRNATVRDNITFTFPYDEERYNDVIEKCELTDDIKILPGGDLTEIGERGINLSGGQKQRISIARAVYSDADIFVIDDCLSALDMHVGGQIFKNVLQGLLKDKTVIFVTHAMHYVEKADYLYVVKKGQIVEHGSPAELRAKNDSEYNQLSVRIDKKEGKAAPKETKDQMAHAKNGKETKVDTQGQPTDFPLVNSSFTIDELEHAIALERLELELKGTNGVPEDGPLVQVIEEKKGPEIDTREETKEPAKGGITLGHDNSNKKATMPPDSASAKLVEAKKDDAKAKSVGTLVKTEGQAEGAVSWAAWKAYFASGGWGLSTLTFSTFFIFQAGKIINDWWLGVWSQDKYGLQSYQYIYIYAIIGVATAIIALIKGICFGFFTKRSAQVIQAGVLWSVLRSPISWFDTTPTGRIINRTSKDQDDIDQMLPFTLNFSFQSVLLLISSIIMIGVILPIFFALAAVFVIAYVWWLRKYIRASREMKRIENVSRSPILQTVAEVCGGVPVIRSFNAVAFYMKDFAQKYNNYLVAAYNGQYAQRWIGMRTELFGDAVIAGTAYFGALSKSVSSLADPALVGLALSYALQVIAMLTFTVKMLGDCEMQMSSFERLLEYKNKEELEADFDTPKAPTPWPIAGKYEINDISFQYRPKLPHVLHKISFSVKQHEKIGVVGRTGSGKSTLTLGLLRILEVIENEGTNEKGTIVLDNQDIAKVGLHELRKRITIIPQDPTLFTGTIKSNIDPFEEFADEKIIDALKKVHIWESLKEADKEALNQFEAKDEKKAKAKKQKKVKEANLATEQAGLIEVVTGDNLEIQGHRKLNMKVDDGGSNFSLGQRQLLCMARALIRDSKVLLMDEATASIDEKTDRLLQKMIKTEFTNTTVITIAHRLNTIIQYDKILVLDNGNISEFDSPINLLNGNGIFANLIKSNGPEFEAKMRDLAVHRDKDLE
mmetsp:Transcript_24704/g.28768  ORF Transcript_24704/g.28768 Transcript_24704/m.28768 type:complete len:1543 (+) Transcript_24704:13-4641(+)|eukprot:CAMPEP_0176434632 /NCGR_PEP_ID=MMETSP0127-20121128/16802_1 /TAXON_ID=938130 /ORGANISM="Platyophrya macrostoma, Strain WH" /LENGTH=1542 /DNA_ID=CAMNT_0017817425 /DNA_START=12 /DNA_END=4640 /DNA_ORIENTATION=-